MSDDHITLTSEEHWYRCKHCGQWQSILWSSGNITPGYTRNEESFAATPINLHAAFCSKCGKPGPEHS